MTTPHQYIVPHEQLTDDDEMQMELTTRARRERAGEIQPYMPMGKETVEETRQRGIALYKAITAMREKFIEGIDYMYHYTWDSKTRTRVKSDKPSLLLPGAEKASIIMGTTPEFKEIVAIRDLGNAYFEFECSLIHVTTGNKVNMARGAYGIEDLKKNESPNRNKMLVMAMKRSFIGAVKRNAMLSAWFTQDMADDQVSVSVPPDLGGNDGSN